MPIWLVFVGTVLAVVGMLELGFRVGRAMHRRSPKEKESPVGTFATAMLGLLAFMLGFAFNLAAERYSSRKENVRKEVDAIQTAYLRADFLPEPARSESKLWIERYVTDLVEAPRGKRRVPLRDALATSNPWHRRIWATAVVAHRKDLDTNLGALYVDSLNKVFEARGERAMIERAERIKPPVWAALYGITFLAVLGVAYQTGIAGSGRTVARYFLAGTFALVISLIADLDRVGGYIQVSQEPFEQLEESMIGMKQSVAETPS